MRSSRLDSTPLRLAPLLLVPLAACASSDGGAEADLSPARALLERSLEHHDPRGVWGRKAIDVHWRCTDPGGEVKFEYDVVLGPGGDLAFEARRNGCVVNYSATGDSLTTKIVGSPVEDLDLHEAMALDRDDGFFWRDYLGFLGGLPMNFAEPGVLLDPEVERAELDGREVLALRARFDPAIGTDVWTLYFEPEGAALVGCRFDRADPERDGETLVFTGETEVAGLRLPRERRWLMNEDGRFLGTDELTAGRD